MYSPQHINSCITTEWSSAAAVKASVIVKRSVKAGPLKKRISVEKHRVRAGKLTTISPSESNHIIILNYASLVACVIGSDTSRKSGLKKKTKQKKPHEQMSQTLHDTWPHSGSD